MLFRFIRRAEGLLKSRVRRCLSSLGSDLGLDPFPALLFVVKFLALILWVLEDSGFKVARLILLWISLPEPESGRRGVFTGPVVVPAAVGIGVVAAAVAAAASSPVCIKSASSEAVFGFKGVRNSSSESWITSGRHGVLCFTGDRWVLVGLVVAGRLGALRGVEGAWAGWLLDDGGWDVTFLEAAALEELGAVPTDPLLLGCPDSLIPGRWADFLPLKEVAAVNDATFEGLRGSWDEVRRFRADF